MIEVSPNLKERIKRNRDDLNSYKHLPNEGWDVYGSTIEDYNGIFTLAKKPISEIAKTKEELVVIDFMGSSEAIASLFGKLLGKKKMGISVSFADVRKHEQVKRDENLNIQQIAGDILERKTWKEVEKALGD